MSSDFRIKVLIAHRDALVAAGAAAVLQNFPGFEVLEQRGASTSGQPALPSVGPMVVLADYELGLQQAAAHTTGILILTHLDGEAHVRSAIERGIRGYLHVGCSVEALREGIVCLSRGGTAFSPLVASKIAESLTHALLTEREMAVMRLILRGLSNKAISVRLCITVGTVKTHVKTIFRKLGVNTRLQAAAVAHARGLSGAAEVPNSGVAFGTRRFGHLKLPADATRNQLGRCTHTLHQPPAGT
jgi:DNA-binding NarL/FixJ family response regulator